MLQVLIGEHLGQDREDPPQLQVLGAHMSNICTLRIRQRCSRGLARNRHPLPGSLDEDLRGIGSFAAVTALDLNTCTGLTPKGLAHVAAMTRLRHLALRGTSMGSPVAFGAFGEVGALSPLTSIAAMTQLVKLDMEHCTELQSLSMQCFSVLRQLTALSLATTGLCEPSVHQCSPCAVLACLTKLRVLNVNDTFIAAGLTKLSVLTCLERLHLGGNSCGSDIVRSMSGCDDSSIGQLTVLTRLTRLQVPACTRLSDDGYRAVGQMTSLQELDLCDTFVKDEQVKYLTALQRLKALAIDSSPEPSQQPITYSTGLWALTVLRNLRFIDLGSGHLSVRTGKQFRRQRRIRLHRDIERCTEENRLFWNSNSFFRE